MLTVRSHPVGKLQMNAYVLVCDDTNASVLVDPGDDPPVLRQLVAGTTPRAIVLTHSHADHVGVLDIMREELAVPVLAHPGPRSTDVAVDRLLVGGDILTVGTTQLDVVATPGHSDDMLSFIATTQPVALVGDTLFAGGPGRTRTAAAFQTTLRTLREIVLQWDDALHCYPGHGASFRLGDIRAAVAAFVARDHGAFYGDATWEHGAAGARGNS